MARAAAALLVAAVLAVVSMSAGASSNETAAQQSLPFSGWYTGSATFYGGPQVWPLPLCWLASCWLAAVVRSARAGACAGCLAQAERKAACVTLTLLLSYAPDLPQDSATTEYDVTISSGSCGYGDIDPKLW